MYSLLVCIFFFPLIYFSFSYFLFYLFILLKNIFFSHIQTTVSPHSTPSRFFSLPFFPRSTLSLFPFRKKKQASNRKQPNIAKQYTIRQAKVFISRLDEEMQQEEKCPKSLQNVQRYISSDS